MSSPNNYQLVLTEQAQLDIDDILLYTFQTWGEQQVNTYSVLLDNALQFIQANPRLGPQHKQLPIDYRSYRVGRHLIVYKIEGTTIYVLRVLHDRMDVPRHIK